MRFVAVLGSLVLIAATPAHPHVVGQVSQEDVRAITATIRAVTHDRIVFIRATSSPERVGVQTESGPSAGCHYLLQRTGGAWSVAGKNCWTQTTSWPQDGEKRRSPETPEVHASISRADVQQIKQVLQSVSAERITIIESVRSQRWPFPVLTDTVDVWMSSKRITGDTYRMKKMGNKWTIEWRGQWIR
jgi:hypothetical protein